MGSVDILMCFAVGVVTAISSYIFFLLLILCHCYCIRWVCFKRLNGYNRRWVFSWILFYGYYVF